MTTPISMALAARNPEFGESLHGLLEEAASPDELAKHAPRPFSTPVRRAARPTARASVRAALRKVFA